MSVQIARRQFNVADFYQMLKAGILTENDRVELIDGEVVERSPIGSRHAGCVNRLTTVLGRMVGRHFIVAVQNPIHVDNYSEPQPDVAVLTYREDFYSRSHPTPADVVIVVEVADTSVEYNRLVKVPLYARAGIAEVWLVNLASQTVEVYSQAENGAYTMMREIGAGQEIIFSRDASLILRVDDLLG